MRGCGSREQPASPVAGGTSGAAFTGQRSHRRAEPGGEGRGTQVWTTGFAELDRVFCKRLTIVSEKRKKGRQEGGKKGRRLNWWESANFRTVPWPTSGAMEWEEMPAAPGSGDHVL